MGDWAHVLIGWVDRAAAATLLPLAAWILVSGIDDLFVCCAYLYARWTRRFPPLPEAGTSGAGRRIAIFVPLWQEEAVIRGMLEHNLAAVKYANFDFFVGAYPNDPGTIRAVRLVADRSQRIHLALCPHDGPTSKADCLNWIYQRMLLHERENDVRFDVVMLHDAEDLMHPEELRLIDSYSADYDMIQVPVLPLTTPLSAWTHGIYCDDFAEFHLKDLPARWWLGGFIPSSGVGTAFSRTSIEALAASDSNLIFRPDCLTEDYETGWRLRQLGFRQLFMPVFQTGPDRQPIATREYFPKRFSAAKKQRTRWLTGIALQGWARNGWGRGVRESYWFWRDRKGLLGNPASLVANLLFLYNLAGWALCRISGIPWGLSTDVPHAALLLIPFTAAVGICLAIARAFCSAAIYGWAFAAWSPLRSVLANLLNSLATGAALHRYARSIWLSERLVWLKTEHAYPNLAALETYKQSIEAVLLSTGILRAEALDEARKTAGTVALAEHLLALQIVSEEDMLGAQMLRHHLPGGQIPPMEVTSALLHLLPGDLVSSWKVVPVSIRSGTLKVACTDLPGEAVMERLRTHLRLPLEFHLVTRTNFRKLISKLQTTVTH